ncbi:MAG: hypothetical protein QOJ85_3398 [Solirubrobacteraceae bacterium]|jgi:hypothetical protein|nr:hypothetical protein [Solirubrobacteraceae bacterium]
MTAHSRAIDPGPTSSWVSPASGRWLTGRAGAAAALLEPRARDHATRDFQRSSRSSSWKLASVNLALAAVDHFNRFLGLDPAIVSHEPLAQTAPRALSIDDQRALVRAAEDSKPRDHATERESRARAGGNGGCGCGVAHGEAEHNTATG